MKKDRPIDINSIPEKGSFSKKEIFQHPQPASQGLPLDKEQDENQPDNKNAGDGHSTSKDEGLNEQNSTGTAGAFEGFEDQVDR